MHMIYRWKVYERILLEQFNAQFLTEERERRIYQLPGDGLVKIYANYLSNIDADQSLFNEIESVLREEMNEASEILTQEEHSVSDLGRGRNHACRS